MKKLVVVVALMVAGVWFWRSPHGAVERLREATRDGDPTRLEELIDFGSVRTNLKTDLRAAISNRSGVDDDPVGALGAALGGLFMDPLIDAFVSPEGLAAVARGRMPDDDDANAANVHIDRRGISAFVARFDDAERGSSPALEFNLDGGRWRLVRIVLPVERT